MSYNIQNNECSTELGQGNRGTLTTINTFSDLKKQLIICCLFLTLISIITNLRGCFQIFVIWTRVFNTAIFNVYYAIVKWLLLFYINTWLPRFSKFRINEVLLYFILCKGSKYICSRLIRCFICKHFWTLSKIVFFIFFTHVKQKLIVDIFL